MTGKELINDIIAKANVELSPEHNTLVSDMIHRAELVDTYPKRAAHFAKDIN